MRQAKSPAFLNSGHVPEEVTMQRVKALMYDSGRGWCRKCTVHYLRPERHVVIRIDGDAVAASQRRRKMKNIGHLNLVSALKFL
jgi:hypothetical protein